MYRNLGYIEKRGFRYDPDSDTFRNSFPLFPNHIMNGEMGFLCVCLHNGILFSLDLAVFFIRKSTFLLTGEG